jgi:coenzyme F420-reducing hydrogenase alpha subunit
MDWKMFFDNCGVVDKGAFIIYVVRGYEDFAY